MLAGAFTLSIMILPLIMRSTEEALKAVPDSVIGKEVLDLERVNFEQCFESCFHRQCLEFLAGVILAVGRIVGETAALIYTAGTIADIPDGVYGIRKNAGGSYVQSVKRRASYGSGVCDSSSTACTGESELTALSTDCIVAEKDNERKRKCAKIKYQKSGSLLR